jgi:hypothetical protein
MNGTRFSLTMPALLALAAAPLSASGEPADPVVPAVAQPADDAAAGLPAAAPRVLQRARPRWEWGPHAVSRIYGLAYIGEDEPDDGPRLHGVSLLWSSWDETVDLSGGLGWYLSWQEGGDQTIWSGGFEMTWLPRVPVAPVRFGPRLRLGLEHRDSAPDEGLGGVAAAGLELAFWMGDSFQLALLGDYEWPFHAGSRVQVGLALRFARPRY